MLGGLLDVMSGTSLGLSPCTESTESDGVLDDRIPNGSQFCRNRTCDSVVRHRHLECVFRHSNHAPTPTACIPLGYC